MRKEWANEWIADVRSMRKNLNKATESPEGSAACVCPSPPYIHLSPSYLSGMAKLSITASSASPQGCRQVTAGEKCNKKRVEDGRGLLLFAAMCTLVGWIDQKARVRENKTKATILPSRLGKKNNQRVVLMQHKQHTMETLKKKKNHYTFFCFQSCRQPSFIPQIQQGVGNLLLQKCVSWCA